jgi:AcrR family transcriptional regulator
MESPNVKPTRGRPPRQAEKHVVNHLLESTERLLQNRSYLDLTEQDIASAAGVNRTMIHYYFGDKEGLLFDLLVATGEAVREKLKAFDTLDLTKPAITRRIVEILVDAWYDKPWVTRIMLVELTRTGSTLAQRYKKKYGSQGLGLSYLRPVVGRLVALGVYDARTNVDFGAMAFYSVVTAPLMLAPFSDGFGMMLDSFKKDAWIDYLAVMFDRQLRSLSSNAMAQ